MFFDYPLCLGLRRCFGKQGVEIGRRKNEATLCAEFNTVIAQALNCFVPEEIKTFRSLFRFLMEKAENKQFNLVIDELQEFYNINDCMYSDMQITWDQYKNKTRIHLMVSGSVYSLMQKIFQNAKEPLFGRADNTIKLAAFDLTTLKGIMNDFRPGYSNDDLLALYALTGGVPEYVELFCDNRCLTVAKMIEFMFQQSPGILL